MLLTQFNKNDNTQPLIALHSFPKAELHVHLEGGTLSTAKLTELAKRHDLPIPHLIFGENNNLKFESNNFLDFLKVYDLAASYILTEQDIEEIAFEYLEKCAQQGTLYVELTCSPDHVTQNRQSYSEIHKSFNANEQKDEKSEFKEVLAAQLNEKYKTLPNINYQQFITSVARGIDRSQQKYGIEARILVVLLRHNGPIHCHEMIQNMIDHPHPYVVGINLAGDEVAFPPELFVEHYAKAKAAGLKLTAHVGEHTKASYIKNAIDLLQLDRIGHGTSAIESPELMKKLCEKNIGIEANISSNLACGVLDDINQHPFKQFLKAGILVSLNTDDPTYVNTNIDNEYKLAKQTWGLTDEDLLKTTRNAILSAFCEESLKEKLLAHIDLYTAAQAILKNIIRAEYTVVRDGFMKYLATPSTIHLDQFLVLQKKSLGNSFVNCDALIEQQKQYQNACVQHNDVLRSKKLNPRTSIKRV